MGTVIELRASKRNAERTQTREPTQCQIVIFSGVRIERHETDLDLSHRLCDSAGNGDFDGLGGKPRPRKTS